MRRLWLRLKSPGNDRLFQSPVLEATFGGGECNVAVSLANYGIPASFVTAVPKDNVGDAAIAEVRRFGVDTSFIKRQGERLGIYFLEIFVAFLQAFIFSLLASVFIGQMTEAHH